MKKTIVALASCVVAVAAYGQGYLQFGNSAVSLIRTNDTKNTMTAGNMQNAMGPFLFEIYYAAGTNAYSSGNASLLSPLQQAGTNVFVKNNNVSAGRLTTIGTVPVPGAVGDLITVQVRGWSASLGATWAAANAAVLGGATFTGTQFIGQSALGVYKLQASSPAPATLMDNTTFGQQDRALLIPGFDLTPVPEPSTIALVGLGLAGLYFIRRRK